MLYHPHDSLRPQPAAALIPSSAPASVIQALSGQFASWSSKAALRFVLCTGVLLSWLFALTSPASAATPMQQYVEAMQPGWNLGNTLDATPNETAWGNPLVTQEFIQEIKAPGF